MHQLLLAWTDWSPRSCERGGWSLRQTAAAAAAGGVVHVPRLANLMCGLVGAEVVADDAGGNEFVSVC